MTDSIRIPTSKFITHLCFTLSQICPLFHLEQNLEYFEPTTSFRRHQDFRRPRPIDQNLAFCSMCSNKINRGFNKIRHLHAPTLTVMHIVIKPAMFYVPTKLATKKIVVALSPRNALNMTLVSPKLSSHLLQFMSFQFCKVDLAPFVKILFVLVMPT